MQAPGHSSTCLFPPDTGKKAERDFSGPSTCLFNTFPRLTCLPPSSCYSKREPRGRKIYNSILIFWYVTLHTETALPKLRVPLGKSPLNFRECYHPEKPGFCFIGSRVTLSRWIAYLFM